MLWIYRFAVGFIEAEISGDVAEVILNICAKNGISLWNIRRKGKKIRCCITVTDFKTLPRFAKKSGTRVHILKRFGLPFFINRYRRRFGIPVGAVLFFCFLFFMSAFVWTVEIKGNKTIAEEEILASCEKIGIKEGVLKSKIDPQIAKQELLLMQNKLAWASVNLEGSIASVNVTEVKEKEEDNSIATNLKAAADGIITKIDVTSGNCVVKVGDTVAKGQLLVSGVIERENSTRFVHSSGSITAKTEREIRVSADFERTVSVKTGKLKKRSVLSFFGIKIPLYLGSVNGSFESHTEKNDFKLLGEKLPISIQTRHFEMTNEKVVIVSKDILLKDLDGLLKAEAQKNNIGVFEFKNREYEETKDGITLKAIIAAEENIAEPEILLFSSGN